jgi:hypothetical protein
MGYYAPATNRVPRFVEFVQNAFHADAFPQDGVPFAGLQSAASTCAERRMHPYSLSRQRIERSYR